MPRLSEFKLERYFAHHEFTAPHLLCCSDCESWTIKDLLALEPGSEDQFYHLSLGYTEAPGGVPLRREINSLYDTLGVNQVLVTAGAEEGIFIFINSMFGPGDHIIAQTPGYQSLHEVAKAAGCEVSCWQMQAGDGGWSVDVQALKGLISDRTRAIIINNPHNPTGYIMSRAELDYIIGLAREHDLYIFSDEVYRYLEQHREERLPAVCDIYGKAVSLGVMSKAFGLAGLRIGWLGTHDQKALENMKCYKDYTTICCSAPSEFLAALAIRNRERILGHSRHIIQENLKHLTNFFARHNDLFSWYPPQAGPIAFPALVGAKDSERFCAELVQKAGVLLAPGYLFDYPGPHFRIGFGRRNLPEVLNNLEDYLKRNF
ncbi:MAG: aminotransferase class I/II-fold pyridoxal phosphate-dependent enzyme [Methanomassiliicoccales archaeon]